MYPKTCVQFVRVDPLGYPDTKLMFLFTAVTVTALGTSIAAWCYWVRELLIDD